MTENAYNNRHELLSRLAVVLARPAFAGNLGATARVMANFGVRRGILVSPRCDVNSLEARQYATGSSAVTLATMSRVQSLREALVGAKTAVALTRRTGKMRQPTLTFDGLSERLAQGDVCLVFGPEESGLTEDDVALCSDILTLDVADQMPSLNLSHAVAVTLSQIYSACHKTDTTSVDTTQRPDMTMIHSLTGRMLQAIQALESRGLVTHGEHLSRILSAHIRRSQLDSSELDAWQAVMSAILKSTAKSR
jgi:TrmH family RNA methyltransferase